MNRYLLIFLLPVCGYCFGQRTEFTVYENGLIYSEATMDKLGTIVDSLNIRFRTCDLAHPYYSLPQGMATKVKVPDAEALALIESGASLEGFSDRYPESVEEKLWIIKYPYRNYEDSLVIEYSGLPYGWNSEFSITVPDTGVHDKTSGWIVSRDKQDAFYITNLKRTVLSHDYARLVQYVDCMIDTTAKIYLDETSDDLFEPSKSSDKATEFVQWAENFPNEPSYPTWNGRNNRKFETAYEKYNKNYNTWDSLRLLHVDAEMKKDLRWLNLLAEATKESLDQSISSEEFEFYVARYLSPETALQLKRRRKPMGRCSMDQRPRYHAMQICVLAAETAKWDIFLRSHLDIMNDRFERVSDGSYAWAGRKTYLKELEALDIPAVDLLIGTSLRVDNVSDNHYWSSIGRTGRALTDAEDKPAIEQRLLAMVKDENLDPYNRLLMAYLFNNYAHHLDNELQAFNLRALDEAVSTLPAVVKELWGKK